ncbi:MAG: serine/threonine-protein kinase [Planctomycetota bacterium]
MPLPADPPERGTPSSDDSGPIPLPDDGHEEESIPMPADTLAILSGNSPTGGSGSSGSNTGGASIGGTQAELGTSIDTIIGRMVIEQGLATSQEVDAVIKQRTEQAPESDDPNHRSLAQLLVDHEIVTERQLKRLRGQAEAERTEQKIPGFKILGKLGAGAMASVFKARQLSLDRLVAIKVLPRKFSSNRNFIERFYAEGRAAAQLNHPNIVQAFDVGQAGEFHYFVMEYVEGETIHDVIAHAKRISEKDALEIIIASAEALRHAHDRGLVHRDVKPKNIIITPQGVVKMADLGLARAMDDKEAALAEKGKAFGTPYYISPEQIRGELNINAQADIYSLGATLYHMVTGNVPFNGKNPTEVMQKHLKSALVAPDHVNPKLSSGISEVIEMMMAKSRRERYKNCADLLLDLRAVAKGERPPIAHREATTLDLEAIASSEAAMSAPIADDRSREPSPFSHPVVKLMAGMIVLLLVWAVVMTTLVVGG